MNEIVRPLITADAVDRLAAPFARRAAEYDCTGRIPIESLDQAGEAGLFALTVPRDLGGSGAGLRETAAVARRLGAADPAATLILAMTWIQHAQAARERRWPEPLYREVARDAVAGRGLINALRVEPELGSPHRGGLPKTTARRSADGWRISGRKIFSTGAAVLRWFVVFARTDEDEPRVGYFLVPADANGIRIEETWDHLGMRATGSHDVVLDDTSVPASHALDIAPPDAWRSVSPIQSAWVGSLLAAIYLGVADAARDWFVEFLSNRVPTGLGRPLATLDRMQLAVGEIEVLRYGAETLLEAIVAKVDVQPSGLGAHEGAIVKHRVTESAIRIVEVAVALSGNPGLSRASPLERHWRDVQCARVHSPQSDSVLRAAGLEALKPLPTLETNTDPAPVT